MAKGTRVGMGLVAEGSWLGAALVLVGGEGGGAWSAEEEGVLRAMVSKDGSLDGSTLGSLNGSEDSLILGFVEVSGT